MLPKLFNPILGGLFVLLFLACSNPVESKESSSSEANLSWSWDLEVVECEYWDSMGVRIPCTQDTLEGWVNMKVPVDTNQYEESTFGQLWTVNKELFALRWNGDLYHTTHGSGKWNQVHLPAGEEIANAQPIVKFFGKRYIAMISGRLYHFDENGIGSLAKEFVLNQGDTLCKGRRPCNVYAMYKLGDTLYAGAFWDYLKIPQYANEYHNEYFFYKSIDSGKSWTDFKDYSPALSIYDWIEFKGKAYILDNVHGLAQFDGKSFIDMRVQKDGEGYWSKRNRYGGLASINNRLFVGVLGGEFFELKDTLSEYLFWLETSVPTIDTVCGSIVTGMRDTYWNPDSSISPAPGVKFPNLDYGGMRPIFDASQGIAYKHKGGWGATYSPVRIGDTLYVGTNGSPSTKRFGSVLRVNLRNVKMCPDAWARGQAERGVK